MSCSQEFPQDTVFNSLRKKNMSALKMMETMTNPLSQTWTIIAIVNLPPQGTHLPEINKALLGADDKQTGSTSLIGGAQPLPTPLEILQLLSGVIWPFQWMQRLHRNSHHPSTPLLPRTPRCACIGWDIHNPIKEKPKPVIRSFPNPNRTKGWVGWGREIDFAEISQGPRLLLTYTVFHPGVTGVCFLISCGFLGDVSPESKPYDY